MSVRWFRSVIVAPGVMVTTAMALAGCGTDSSPTANAQAYDAARAKCEQQTQAKMSPMAGPEEREAIVRACLINDNWDLAPNPAPAPAPQ